MAEKWKLSKRNRPHSQNSKGGSTKSCFPRPLRTKTPRSVYEFNKHHKSSFPILNGTDVVVPKYRSAAYLVTMGYNYIGTQADINIWNPKVEWPEEFTTAQIWLKGGNGADFESVEAGWVVNPKLYGDRGTRLFTGLMTRNWWLKLKDNVPI